MTLAGLGALSACFVVLDTVFSGIESSWLTCPFCLRATTGHTFSYF